MRERRCLTISLCCLDPGFISWSASIIGKYFSRGRETVAEEKGGGARFGVSGLGDGSCQQEAPRWVGVGVGWGDTRYDDERYE